ncbi:hypothetical protein PPYR_10159 [Photinus pyralis]|uniref:HTH CENPB-type domain-containing protein n=1 Tax=Photinus pyralis TaxID=7054 RepID=A0A5N4AFT9_PHOPY|nr:hypothetical protein PPYR_10159 [Photinus pyralis]
MMWTEEDLRSAMDKVKTRQMGVNEACRVYNTPSRTLRRHLNTCVSTKVHVGKLPVLGVENENRLVKHIKKLQSLGFSPTPSSVREIAFSFATKLNLASKFSTKEETKAAGMHWFYSFMDRHPDLAVRKSEGLSLARAKGMKREEVDQFVSLKV